MNVSRLKWRAACCTVLCCAALRCLFFLHFYILSLLLLYDLFGYFSYALNVVIFLFISFFPFFRFFSSLFSIFHLLVLSNKCISRSEKRMRQHASKQNSIPNNLRVMQAPTSTQIGTKDTNNRKTGQSVVMATQLDSKTNIALTGGASVSGVGGTVIAPSIAGHTMPSGKFAQLKSIRVKDTRDAKAKRNEWRITKMVLAIFLSFVFCYLPITVTKIADKDVHYPTFHIFGYIMLYLSSCINPIIYVIMNKQYRQAYKTVILCQPARLLAFTHGGSSVGGKICITEFKQIVSNDFLRNVISF